MKLKLNAKLNRYKVLLILAGVAILATILVKFANLEWKFAFLISIGLAILQQLLKLNWQMNDNQESISALKGIYPFLTPTILKEIWDYAYKHPIFLNWTMTNVGILEKKLKDLKEGIYEVQTDFDIHNTIEVFDDVFTGNDDYVAVGHLDRTLHYFATENGENFLRRLDIYKRQKKIRAIKRVVILPEGKVEDHKFQSFIQLHHRFNWEIWTIGRKKFEDTYPDTLKNRMISEALDVGFFGGSYICEATHQGCQKPFLKWVHNEEIIKNYRDFFNNIFSIASLRNPPDEADTTELPFDAIYRQFRQNYENYKGQ